jgi:hypothetical protein
MAVECRTEGGVLSKIEIAPSATNEEGQQMFIVNLTRFLGETAIGDAFIYVWVKGSHIEYPSTRTLLTNEHLLINQTLQDYARKS